MEKYLVTKEEIESYAGLEKTHFLNSNARRLNQVFRRFDRFKKYRFPHH